MNCRACLRFVRWLALDWAWGGSRFRLIASPDGCVMSDRRYIPLLQRQCRAHVSGYVSSLRVGVGGYVSMITSRSSGDSLLHCSGFCDVSSMPRCESRMFACRRVGRSGLVRVPVSVNEGSRMREVPSLR